MSWLYDLHFHLAWVSDAALFVKQSEKISLGGLGVTVTPAEYEKLVSLVGTKTSWVPALGFHPWYREEAHVERFIEIAKNMHAIGEIGLDFNRTRASERTLAVAEFRRICEAILPESVISLHAVRSVAAVLDVLKTTGRLKDCACIFHWFSDSGEMLAQAREEGCYFSINARQLETRKGKAYVAQIPLKHLLLETDLPKASQCVLQAEELREILLQTERALGVRTNVQAHKLLLQATH